MEHITGRSNPLMTRIRKLRDSRSFRRNEGEFLCDGVKMLDEALRWGAEIGTCILSPDLIRMAPEGVRCVSVPEELMRSLSPMQAPQGVLFTVKFNGFTAPKQLAPGHYLVLDGLQDPGNVGTILRTADAFGAGGILLTNHCADPTNPKSVRATMGAIFRLPIYEVQEEELVRLVKDSGLALCATALREDTLSLPDACLEDCAVVIGNEGNGVSPSLLKQCSDTIRIPIEDRCESLNAAAAAAVVLWEMYRR